MTAKRIASKKPRRPTSAAARAIEGQIEWWLQQLRVAEKNRGYFESELSDACKGVRGCNNRLKRLRGFYRRAFGVPYERREQS